MSCKIGKITLFLFFGYFDCVTFTRHYWRIKTEKHVSNKITETYTQVYLRYFHVMSTKVPQQIPQIQYTQNHPFQMHRKQS